MSVESILVESVAMSVVVAEDGWRDNHLIFRD